MKLNPLVYFLQRLVSIWILSSFSACYSFVLIDNVSTLTFHKNVPVKRTVETQSLLRSAISSEGFAIEDKNGKSIAIGSIVRVTKEGLKAFQVPPKGRGWFDEEKKHVASPSDGSRATRHLAIPVGMRGLVSKVTDPNLSANFPVQVKFAPGENIEEGYDPPVPFIMHFEINEIELV